ncbi:hypothetical protein ACHAXS_002455, partial [Conticribra weissflogii]
VCGNSDSILIREDDEDTGVTKLILNNPSKYNVLSSKMMDLMMVQLEDISGSTSTRVLIIGATGKAFSSGHDLREINSHQQKFDNNSGNQDGQQPLHDLFQKCSEVMLAINNLPQPVIASVQGVATAAGCQLVASCDLSIASQSSRFGVSGINAGLFCSTPAVALSRNVGRKRAMHMLLTGDLISAKEALEYGLVNKVVFPERLEEETMELATKIASKSDFGVRLGKKMFYEQLKFDELGDAYEFALERMVCNLGHDDARAGIDAFMNKKKPRN